jgi:hypothetical protein
VYCVVCGVMLYCVWCGIVVWYGVACGVVCGGVCGGVCVFTGCHSHTCSVC